MSVVRGSEMQMGQVACVWRGGGGRGWRFVWGVEYVGGLGLLGGKLIGCGMGEGGMGWDGMGAWMRGSVVTNYVGREASVCRISFLLLLVLFSSSWSFFREWQ